MTYQNKAELFRIYLRGKVDFAKKDQGKALQAMFDADFGSKAYYRASEKYEAAGAAARAAEEIRKQFERIFKEEDK